MKKLLYYFICLFLINLLLIGDIFAQCDDWTQKANFGGGTRRYCIGFSIGDMGYIGLGTDGSKKKDLWQYNPQTDTWTQKADFGGTAREAAACFTLGRKAYVGCGYDNITWVKDFWEYDTLTNAWTQKTDFGGLGRKHPVGFSIGDKGYIGTGQDVTSTRQNDLWEYDTTSNSSKFLKGKPSTVEPKIDKLMEKTSRDTLQNLGGESKTNKNTGGENL